MCLALLSISPVIAHTVYSNSFMTLHRSQNERTGAGFLSLGRCVR